MSIEILMGIHIVVASFMGLAVILMSICENELFDCRLCQKDDNDG